MTDTERIADLKTKLAQSKLALAESRLQVAALEIVASAAWTTFEFVQSHSKTKITLDGMVAELLIKRGCRPSEEALRIVRQAAATTRANLRNMEESN